MGVKIEFNKPKETVDETSNKTKLKPQHTSVTNADLNLSAEELRTWKTRFLPTLYAYIRSSGKPWEMGVDEAFLTDFNMLWSSIFPQHHLTIETSSFQYRLVHCINHASCLLTLDYLGRPTSIRVAQRDW
jgi:hypothetical protein